MDFRLLEKKKDTEPLPDIGICSECHGRYPLDKCPAEEDGTWEEGFYAIHICPRCLDGGCLDDYDYSPEQLRKYEKWKIK